MSTSRVGKVTLDGRALTHDGVRYDVAGAHAVVETDGEVVRRFTATRILVLGVFALAFKKSKDKRGLYLLVEGPGYAFVAELDPKRDALLARQMAAAITSAGKRFPFADDAAVHVSPPAPGGSVAVPVPVPVPVLAAPMHLEGYMIEVDWDGATLRAHGTNKMSRIALNGADHDADVVLAASDIASIQFKAATAMVNGVLTIGNATGRSHQLHFRRKSADEFARLHESLTAAQPFPMHADEGTTAIAAAEPDPGPDRAIAAAASPAPPSPPPAPNPAPPVIPPGWHPDPHQVARLRYWDGMAWTEHTAD